MAAASVTLAVTKRQLETADGTRQTHANDWQTQLAAANTQNAQLAGAVSANQPEAGVLKAKLVASQTALKAANERLARSQ